MDDKCLHKLFKRNSGPLTATFSVHDTYAKHLNSPRAQETVSYTVLSFIWCGSSHLLSLSKPKRLLIYPQAAPVITPTRIFCFLRLHLFKNFEHGRTCFSSELEAQCRPSQCTLLEPPPPIHIIVQGMVMRVETVVGEEASRHFFLYRNFVNVGGYVSCAHRIIIYDFARVKYNYLF